MPAAKKKPPAKKAAAPKQVATKAAAKPAAKKPPVKKLGRKKVAANPALGDILTTLVDGAIALIDENLDDKPAALLKPPTWKASYGLRGRFTDSVQNIFVGAIDEKEARRMLSTDFAPFVDGPGLAMALQHLGAKDDLTVHLADQFALRAADDLARALLALALLKPEAVPATCAAFIPALAPHVAKVRDLLA
ncbi:MAG: hypothetical protein K8W52_26170 [Deltaproteobacteria bacterium]|nr:hypothetical protein [Deltaproteobacteria bacterium]